MPGPHPYWCFLYITSHFADEKTETRKWQVACPRARGKDLNLGSAVLHGLSQLEAGKTDSAWTFYRLRPVEGGWSLLSAQPRTQESALLEGGPESHWPCLMYWPRTEHLHHHASLSVHGTRVYRVSPTGTPCAGPGDPGMNWKPRLQSHQAVREPSASTRIALQPPFK